MAETFTKNGVLLLEHTQKSLKKNQIQSLRKKCLQERHFKKEGNLGRKIVLNVLGQQEYFIPSNQSYKKVDQAIPLIFTYTLRIHKKIKTFTKVLAEMLRNCTTKWQ